VLTELVFSDIGTIDLHESGVVVIVGPNNSGKSRALQNIFDFLRKPAAPVPVVCSPEFRKVGTVEDLKELLAPYYGRLSDTDRQGYSGPEFRLELGEVEAFWQGNLEDLASAFCLLLDTNSRLRGCDPVHAHASGVDRPTLPLQFIYDDPDLEARLSEIFRDVFGAEIVTDPRPGSQISLRLGKRPELAQGEQQHGKDYLTRVRSLPLLHEQGDGTRSFASVLFAIKIIPRSIILIDEPEAFLHPPQARRLGSLLAEEQPNDCQIVIATHSEDIIQGLLSKRPDRVAVIRLTREGSDNHATQLDNTKVAALWNSPLLRYSNILSGLFHEGVIIAESDADCRFYEAIAEVVQSKIGRAPDIFYTHCGGKHRIPVLVDALKSLDVPVRAVADVDVLREETLIERIVTSLGGQWSSIKPNWTATRRAVEQRKAWFKAGDLLERIQGVLSRLDKEAVVDKRSLDAIADLGRQTSPWAEVKRNGLPGPLVGDDAKRARDLLGALAKIGLFVVPVGELECFMKTAGGHGPTWVEAVLGSNLANSSELREAREFVEGILNSFRSTQHAS
jgi:energy-coupling factor transporter ATP-binding protein EcfA2